MTGVRVAGPRARLDRLAGAVVAGGLLYVYDWDGGAFTVYVPTTGERVASLPAGRGHWNTPIVTDGRIALGQEDANADVTFGVLNIYRLP